MIVIGDVHGCYYTLKKLLKKLPQDKKLCFVGDLIDRGKYSPKVVNLVKALVDDNKAICLRGNHEQMFIDYFSDTPDNLFILNGGEQTIKQFKDQSFSLIEAYNFFTTLPFKYKYNNFIISHALSWGIKNDHDLIWNRYMDIPENDTSNSYVFGHIPMKELYICDNVINVDSGAVFGRELSAIDLDTFKIYSVKTDKKDIEVY